MLSAVFLQQYVGDYHRQCRFLLQVERTGDLAQDEDNSVLYLLGRRHSFIQDLQNKIQKATQFIRVCLCIQPEHLQTAALVRYFFP